MADATQYTFSYQELVTLMLKQQGIHEGLWALSFNFGLQAANAGPNSSELKPVAIVAVLNAGIQKVSEASNLTVDAAEVNPAT